MTTEQSDRRWPSRRRFLGSVAAGTVALAGCTGGSETDPANGPDTLDEPPEWPPVLGDPDAAVTLEVFEDFNCPHCQDYNTEQFPEIESEYLDSEQIRYVHRDLPFLHETSWQAVSAVREVYRLYGNEQFWSYKSTLMSEGGRIQQEAPDIFGEIADQQNLDADAIQQAAADREHDAAAREDRSRAEEYGVQGTPAFVVDGELTDDLADARETIDTKLSE
ncbi:DsbA family protein [Halovenus sp. HT40]|uniref:DsbA family protein n=1 Tax=Halovenus sp. HT40 TaxID=3126691 RepID=UPI00300F66AA